MKTPSLNSSLLCLFLFSFLVFTLPSCKKSRERKAAAAERLRKISQAKSELEALLANPKMSVSEKTRRLNHFKNADISDDPEVSQLLGQLKKQIDTKKAALAAAAAAEAEKKRLAEEAQRRKTEKTAPTIYDYFKNIVNATNAEQANTLIEKGLKLFTSADAPVLIALGKDNGITDYDKPTTIRRYLEYLKDQKKDLNKIDKITYDKVSGKIKTLELIRK